MQQFLTNYQTGITTDKLTKKEADAVSTRIFDIKNDLKLHFITTHSKTLQQAKVTSQELQNKINQLKNEMNLRQYNDRVSNLTTDEQAKQLKTFYESTDNMVYIIVNKIYDDVHIGFYVHIGDICYYNEYN